MAERRNFILATAGHVDHGKSAIVRALTGIDPDRLPEEKARGITIDLGFASLSLKTDDIEYQIGIVDVPGHEDFIKNMVAGVGSIDAAMLVVAADDGWMPQTVEHLQILEYLGVTRGIVVLSKSDLVENIEPVTAEIRERLIDSPLRGAPIVPSSVLQHRGIDDIRAALSELFSTTPLSANIAKPRLAVDRAFVLRGVGTVVTGTLAGGCFNRGQQVFIQPGGRASRVRSIQTHNSDIALAMPGTRVALNLSDLPASDPAGVSRGDIVTLESLGNAATVLDVSLVRASRSTGPELRNGATVHLHLATSALPARIQFKELLKPDERSLARLRLLEPAFAFIGDRFVLRDTSNHFTLAGGIVLDLPPTKLRWNDIRQQELLSQRNESLEIDNLVGTQLNRDGFSRFDSLLIRSRCSAAEIEASVARQISAGTVLQLERFVASREWWEGCIVAAEQTIAEHHRSHPEQAAMPIAAIRERLRGILRGPEFFEPLSDALIHRGFVRTPAGIRSRSHRPNLPPRLQAAGQTILATLLRSGLEPPSRNELAPADVAQQALRFLILNHEVIELSAVVAISAGAYLKAVESVRTYLLSVDAATVSEIKNHLGSSRRIVVPLLERMDRDGITRRSGDQRALNVPGINITTA